MLRCVLYLITDALSHVLTFPFHLGVLVFSVVFGLLKRFEPLALQLGGLVLILIALAASATDVCRPEIRRSARVYTQSYLTITTE